MSVLWTIELLGGIGARSPQERITRFATQKTALLLAYLAFYRNKSHLRETLIEILWPEADPSQGRSRLSTLLTYLRNLLEPPGITSGTVLQADRNTIRLNAQTLTTDVAHFEQALAAVSKADSDAERIHALQKASALYTGDLLPGYYEDWVGREQARLSGLYLDGLYALARLYERNGNPHAALDVMEQALRWDAYREGFYRVMMRSHAALGHPEAALSLYDRLIRLLKEEFGASPTATTRNLADQIRRDPSALEIEEEETERAPAKPESGKSELPPVSSIPPPPTEEMRLPIQLTKFVGREEELERLTTWLGVGEPRLITLTGPGGTGKTRLAIEAASRMGERFAGRVWMADLTRITDSRLLPFALRETLLLPPTPNADPMEQVIEKLQESPCLLLMDNFEHLLREEPASSKGDTPTGAGAAGLVRLMLERVPGLTCLITSRQPLHLGGEQEFPVRILPLPETSLPVEALQHVSSVALYVDRARAVRPDFALTAHNSADVAALCRALEGMPLAIEMAAAWAKMLTPARMLERLETRLDVLISRRQDMPKRHQSMRAAIEGSYEALEPPLQRLFAALSVFRGGWSIEEAEAVCREPEVLWNLTSLQERSLIVSEEKEDEIRFRFLETLREFAAEKLKEQGTQNRLRKQHALVFRALAEKARPCLSGPEQAQWLNRLEGEQNNFRAALETCLLEEGMAEEGLRLGNALAGFWILRGHYREGEMWLSRVLAHPEAQEPTLIRAETLHGAGNLAAVQSHYPSARQHYEACLSLARRYENERLMGMALSGLGKVAQETGAFEQAHALYVEALEHCRLSNNRVSEAVALNNLGVIAARQGDFTEARLRYEQSLALRREIHDIWGIANTLRNLGSIARSQGDLSAARAFTEEGLVLQRNLNNPGGIAMALHGLGVIAMDQGDKESAVQYLREGLEIYSRLGDTLGSMLLLEACANLAAKSEQSERAVRLHAVCDALRARIGRPRSAREQALMETGIDELKSRLTEAKFQSLWSEGHDLTLEQALDYALQFPLTDSEMDNGKKFPQNHSG